MLTIESGLTEHVSVTTSVTSSSPPVAAPVPPSATPMPPEDMDRWAHLWFRLVRHPWTSLALVPGDASTSMLDAARRLAEVASQYQGETVHLLNAQRIGSADLGVAMGALAERALPGSRVLLIVASPLIQPAAIPLARAADGAVLVVRLGQTRTADARRTLACVGQAGFLGSITLTA